MAMPICLRLLVHWARRAASRADCTAGKSSAIRTAMMAMTTNSSINVKPRRWRFMSQYPLPDVEIESYTREVKHTSWIHDNVPRSTNRDPEVGEPPDRVEDRQGAARSRLTYFDFRSN